MRAGRYGWGLAHHECRRHEEREQYAEHPAELESNCDATDNSWHDRCDPRWWVMSASLAVFLTHTIRAHRRLFVAAVISLSLLMWAVVGVFVALMLGVAAGLPDNNALRGIGSMARATTVFDASDQAAFTIFK